MKKADSWEKRLIHLLWQFDNRIDFDEKQAKIHWENEFKSFIHKLLKSEKEKRIKRFKKMKHKLNTNFTTNYAKAERLTGRLENQIYMNILSLIKKHMEEKE
ncbi:MAG: hypothetical protein AABY22_18225 [Nanoarchaeota archaeon]